MKKILSSILLIAALFAAIPCMAEDSLKKIDIEGRFIYPQVGFWEAEIRIEGTQKNFGVFSKTGRELLTSNEKGRQYYESFCSRRMIGYGIFGGGMAITVVSYVMMFNNYRSGSSVDSMYYYLGALGGLCVALAGDIIAIYASDDLYRSINEFNRNQVSGEQSDAGGTMILAKNFKF